MQIQQRKAVLILNNSSGWNEKQDVAEVVWQILHESGLECRVIRIAAGTDVQQIATDAVRDGAGLVIAGGGDGTLRAVAAALAGSGVPMGVLPVGTLNHFARDMDIPLDVEQAARTAATGTVVEVDLGEVNGRTFINNSVLGLYPSYRLERASRERRGWSDLPAAAAAWISVFRKYPFLQVRLLAGGIELKRRTPYILIANNEHAMQGSKPWERDRMDAGELWVYILRDRSRMALLRVLFGVLTGRFEAADEFDRVRASDVWIETRRRRIGVSIDGEMVVMATPLHYRSRPRSLRVVVPSDSRRAIGLAAGVERCAS